MATKIVKQGGNALLINTNAGRLDVGALVELVRVGNFQTQQKDQTVNKVQPPCSPDVPRLQAPLEDKPKMNPMKQKSTPSFNLHIGSNLRIPGVENLSRLPKRSSMDMGMPVAPQDPFYGLPFYALAEYLGERAMPALEAAKKEQINQKRQARMDGSTMEVKAPYIPPLLPVTRWASQDERFRSTLVVDDASPKKARMSWYHPEDTMVPRDWFSRGLLDDLKYYSPFGLFSSSGTAGDQHSV